MEKWEFDLYHRFSALFWLDRSQTDIVPVVALAITD